MKAICNGIDLSPYIAQGYTYEREPLDTNSFTTMDGTDHTERVREKVKLKVPFIPLKKRELTEILKLFPERGAYVTWRYEDLYSGQERVIQAKFERVSCQLRMSYRNGVEYYSGLVISLTER